MKSIEFRTRVDGTGNITVPDYYKKWVRKGALVEVVVFGEDEMSYKEVNTYDNYKDKKKIWDKYEFEGIWNGE